MNYGREYRLSFTEKAKAILDQMTLEEKIYMISGHCGKTESMGMGNYNSHPYPFGGCERLGVKELGFCDGPRGVVSGSSTCFPVAMACGATFNRELERQIGAAIGKEVRGNGGTYFGGVCMNIPYHPGAGRSQECFGEDSHHMGEMASALMDGVQSQGVIACAKHFAFNSMETSRFKVNVTADKRTEMEVYFPHFKKVIDRGAASVMSAYNLYQGKKCGHSSYLLREILKNKWGFDGFVVSDFVLGVTSTSGGITGGCDVEMNFVWHYTERKIKRCLAKGKIRQEQIDEACLRIIRTGLAFEELRKTLPQYDKSILACDEHRVLARKAAEESITLLQNKDSFLPLRETIQVALVGDLVDVQNIGDHGSSRVHPPYIKTLVSALREEYPNVKSQYIRTKEVSDHQADIAQADAVILVCGMRHGDEGEFLFTYGGDRKSLELKKEELSMIDQVSALNKNCGVVLMGGNVIMTHSWKDKVKAILFAYYPGMEGGAALADILFGKVNPSGKLPFAIAEREDAYPKIQWKTRKQHYGYYHGYQKIDKEQNAYDFPFGYGLSYTSFKLAEPKLVDSNDKTAEFEVTVTNTGERDGAEVVQLYVSFPESKVNRPVRALKGFEKVAVPAGESRTVRICVCREELGWYDETADAFVQDTRYRAQIGTDEQTLLPDEIYF